MGSGMFWGYLFLNRGAKEQHRSWGALLHPVGYMDVYKNRTCKRVLCIHLTQQSYKTCKEMEAQQGINCEGVGVRQKFKCSFAYSCVPLGKMFKI